MLIAQKLRQEQLLFYSFTLQLSVGLLFVSQNYDTRGSCQGVAIVSALSRRLRWKPRMRDRRDRASASPRWGVQPQGTWREGQGRSGDQTTPQCSGNKFALIEQIWDQPQSSAQAQLPQVRMILHKDQGQRAEFNAASKQDSMDIDMVSNGSFDGSIFWGFTAAPNQTKVQREKWLQALLMEVEPLQLWGTVSLI